jgi:penicillin-insensitive murein endopeptidase
MSGAVTITIECARPARAHTAGCTGPHRGSAAVLAAILAAILAVSAAANIALAPHAAAQQPLPSPTLPTKAPATAQSAQTDPRELVPAKQLFGHIRDAAPLPPQAIGFYSRGCLAGGEQLETDGPAWQAMRLSRNRNWGHPTLVKLVRRLAVEAQKHDGWPGLLVGDLAQPRGGPMLTGHASHQIGLDADIWFTQMPDRRLSRLERERLSATSMLATKITVDERIWSQRHVRLIRRAASYPEVERILVHPAIKKALCDGATEIGGDRGWLAKVRPYWGHHYHFHVRIGCPPGSGDCRNQKPTTDAPGCTTELDYWFKLLQRPPRPKRPKPKTARKPQIVTLSKLPAACRTVLDAAAIIPPRPVAVQR